MNSRRRRRNNKSDFSEASMLTVQEICEFFETQQNYYTSFILKMEKEPRVYSVNTSFEMHHKIPKYLGGPDIPENLIRLSVEEHAKAYQLLYEVYGHSFDLCASLMRKGFINDALTELRKGIVQQMREKKQGRFNSENQRKCGLKNKGVSKKPHAKNIFIQKAFENGMIWIHENGEEVIIEPNSMVSVQSLTDHLIFAFSEEQKKAYFEKGSRAYAYVGINKILQGTRDPKTNKAMFAVGPWRLKGIYRV